MTRELQLIDQLVSLAYQTMGRDPQLLQAASMLYFAAATSFEGRPPGRAGQRVPHRRRPEFRATVCELNSAFSRVRDSSEWIETWVKQVESLIAPGTPSGFSSRSIGTCTGRPLRRNDTDLPASKLSRQSSTGGGLTQRETSGSEQKSRLSQSERRLSVEADRVRFYGRKIESSPPAPLMMSSPPPPRMMLAPELPVRLSLKVEPLMFSNVLSVSVPAAPEALPVVRFTVTLPVAD